MTKILEDKENPLLNRREIRLLVEADKNPSYDEATNILAKEFKAEADKILIKQIKGKFGRNTFLISAFIYKSKEDKEKFELKKKAKKTEEETEAASPQVSAPAGKPEEKARVEKKEEKAEEKKEAKPAEEVSEEKKEKQEEKTEEKKEEKESREQKAE